MKRPLGAAGQLAVAFQAIFFLIVTTCAYRIGFGLQPEQNIVLGTGMATRNIGAALAPLFSVAGMDQQAIIMVVPVFPINGDIYVSRRKMVWPPLLDGRI